MSGAQEVAHDALAIARQVTHVPSPHTSISWSSPLPDLFARLDHLTHQLINALIDHSELLIAEKQVRAAAMIESRQSTATGRDQDASIAAIDHSAETIRTSNLIRGLEAEIAHLRFVIQYRSDARSDQPGI